jgi:hypothetical protein
LVCPDQATRQPEPAGALRAKESREGGFEAALRWLCSGVRPAVYW